MEMRAASSGEVVVIMERTERGRGGRVYSRGTRKRGITGGPRLGSTNDIISSFPYYS